MNRTLRLIIALAVIMMATSSCKTKQKVAEIPAGANIEAAATTTTPATSTNANANAVSTVNSSETVSNVAEVTRNENFSLAEGETNADVLKFKYHVVVGSFSKQTNAKGLQTTLRAEGNKAVIVVNEKGMFRLLISSYNDYNQAHVRIKEIASRFPDAWVLVQK
jgi:cell division protein FtsN